MQINEEELVNEIRKYVSDNLTLSQISDDELEERIDQIVSEKLKDLYCPIETKVSISQQIFSSIRGFGLLDSIMNDKSGNPSAVGEKHINIDSTNPEVSIVVDSEKSSAFVDGWNNGTLVYKVHATDNASGIMVKNGVPVINYSISNADGKVEDGLVSVDTANCTIDASTGASYNSNSLIAGNFKKKANRKIPSAELTA